MTCPIASLACAFSLAAAPLTIANGGAASLSCQVLLAHWFAIDVGPIAMGESATVDLKADPGGALVLLNERGDAMAVERIECGAGPRASWRQLPLRAGPQSVTCDPDCRHLSP